MKSTLDELVLYRLSLEQKLLQTEEEKWPEILAEIKSLNIENKTDACFHVIETFSRDAAYMREQAAKFTMMARKIERAEEVLRSYVKENMQALGVSEIVGNQYRLHLVSTQDRLVVDSEALPDRFKTVVTEMKPDNKKIRDCLEDGIKVPGARLEPSFALRGYVTNGIAKRPKSSVYELPLQDKERTPGSGENQDSAS